MKYNSKNLRSEQYNFIMDLYDEFNLAGGKFEGMGYPEDDDVEACGDIKASTRYMANMVSASDDGYEQLAEDEDDYYKYYVVGYFDNQQRGVDDNLQTRYFSDALDFAHDLACNGDFITIKNLITGDFVTYTPDEWMEAIDLGDVPSSVYTIR
jgi:hypothetical protein